MTINWEREKERLMAEYRTPIPVKKSRIELPTQKQLIEYTQLKATTHGVGTYYEALTRAIFGGTQHDREHMENSYSNLSKLVQETVDAVPDLTDHIRGIHWESKGLSLVGGDLKLYDKQVRRYIMLQANLGRITDPRITYCVFCYNIGNKAYSIQKMSEGKLENIIPLLSENTTFAFFLPLSLILHLHQKGTSRSTHKRTLADGTREEDPMTRIRPKQLLRIMQEPVREIESTRLRARDYEIHRTSLPPGVTFNAHKVSQFPILIIRDINHASWLSRFKRIYHREAEEGMHEIEDEAIEYGLFDILKGWGEEEPEEKSEHEEAEEGAERLPEGEDVEGDEIPF